MTTDDPGAQQDVPQSPEGEFDSAADALWANYGREAKSRDKDKFNAIKDDMNSVFLFAGLFAAALAPFIIDSKRNLTANSSNQIVYYCEQHSILPSHISHHISSIVPNASIPFIPTTSDLLINAFWFSALVFSLMGALIATLVQKWARRCLHPLQFLGNPMENVQHRQFISELFTKSNLFAMAKLASIFLHLSLFLFFAGLWLYTWNLNWLIAGFIIVPSSLCMLFYISFTFMSAEYPQTPFRSPISTLIRSWFLKLRRLVFRGDKFNEAYRFGPETQRSMKLLKKELKDRKRRDERAIRWLIGDLVEDAEMESFVSAIPRSFDTDWGVEIWKKVSESESLISAPTGLYARVSHLLDTCKNTYGGDLTKQPELRRRTRACIEATALLVCRANAKLDRFGNIVKLLGDIGSAENVRSLSTNSSLVERHWPFVISWTCLSLVVIRSILDHSTLVREKAHIAVESLAGEDDTGDEQALAGAQDIDATFRNARSSQLPLKDALFWILDDYEEAMSMSRHYEPQVSQLEKIHTDADRLSSRVDLPMFDVQSFIVTNSQGVIGQLPGVQFDDIDSETGPTPIQFSGIVEWSRDPPRQIIFPGRTLKSISSRSVTFRAMLESRQVWHPYARELLKDVQEFLQNPTWEENLLQRQLWRLQDLRDGGGLGFTVELFLLALKQLLSTTSSNKYHSPPLYIGTFRVMTSDWAKCRQSLGTQKLLLDMISPDQGILFKFRYPRYITDEFLVLLRNILGPKGYADLKDAIQKLSAHAEASEPAL